MVSTEPVCPSLLCSRLFYSYSETIESENPDEPFISELLMAMYQVVYMHKGSPFSASETDIIKNVVSFIAEAATEKGITGYYDGDIKSGEERSFNELQSHEG